jgi:small basic protein (TIGR04137 family)
LRPGVPAGATWPHQEPFDVTIDKSLKRKGRLARTRSVLSRDERIKQMKTDDRWIEGQSPFGLPKLRVVRLVVGKKKKKKAAEGADTTAAAPADKKVAKKK